MMHISLGGLIGAMAGTLIAAVTYHLFVGALEKAVRDREQRPSPEVQGTSDVTLSAIRRVVLITDLVLFAGVGYWLGDMIGA
ncbi:MAG: hypothetical protein ACRECO_04550 [Xanthobacteraceae bacterium]